ncbi:hypothetical protein F5I97DRAFT_1782375, partial [Phlebopus sp. FC_14]
VSMSSSDVHPSAVGTNTRPECTQASEGSTPESIYPPQRHAGAVGLGPEYGKGTGFGETLAGLQEQIKGKILRKPELVEHGRERRTGELKKKERE